MSASPRRHSPTAAAAPRQGPGPAVGAPSSCTRGNLGAEISSWHRAARRMKKGTHPGPGKHKNMGRFEREHPHCGVSGFLPICPTGKSDCVTSSLLKTTEIEIFEKVPSLKPLWEQFLGQQQQQRQQQSTASTFPAREQQLWGGLAGGTGEPGLQGGPSCRQTSLGNCLDSLCPHSHSTCRIPSAHPLALQ